MGDPERLLSSITDADDLERELLASIRKADPPLGAKDEGWGRLSAQIAAVALVGTAHGSAAASGASAAAHGAKAAGAASVGAATPLALKLLSSKIAVALAVSGVAIGASAVWVHWSGTGHATPAVVPAVTAPAPNPPSQSDLSAALPAPDPALQLAPDTGAKQAPTPSADQKRKDLLSAESALLTRARAYLRNGDANSAQQTLNKLLRQFPKGVLRQEREVLAIEVLSARGNKAAARRRAQAFIAAYPESPHSAQLSRFADAP